MQLVLPQPEHDDETAFTVHTEVFDGPLDLLLYLVKRDGIALARLEVSRIADAYLAYLDRMRDLDLSIAADWLVMAATLIHLKALGLFPRPPTIQEEDEEDPRDALIEQLRRYEDIKARANALDGRGVLGREVVSRAREPAPSDDGRPWVSPVDAFGLLDVLHELLARAAEPEPVVRMGDGGPDVGGCCRRVLAALGGKGGLGDLAAMIRTLASRAERVITFIVVLEMTRLMWLDLEQEVHLGPVAVIQVVEDEVIDLTMVTGREPVDPDEQMELPLPERSA